MKKLLWLFGLVVFLVSCSSNIEVEGTVTGGSPLERVEIIEASGVATLPLVNMGVDEKGKFSGKFKAPKNGMYVIAYAGQQNLVYLKKGQKLEIQGKAGAFPAEYSIKGDAQANNEFLKQAQKSMNDYTMKMNLQQEMNKDEASFVKFLSKVQEDLSKKMEELAQKTKADADVLQWKKDDLKTGILALIPQFVSYKKQVTGNLGYIAPKSITDFEQKLQDNKDELVKEHPLYRQYLLSKMADDFQKYVEAKASQATPTNTQLFNQFIKQRKELSQIAKDYLLAFVMTQYDISPALSNKEKATLKSIIDTDIKEKAVKEDMNKVLFVVGGFNVGEELPKTKLVKADNSSFDITAQKGKPTLLVHYASWVPGLQESAVPVIKQMVDFYKSKFNFVFINFDDTKAQFEKTSNTLLKDIVGTKVYAENGLKSDYAEKMGIYGFKLSPSLLILDKQGKVAGRLFFNAGDPEFVALMDKQSGLKAPAIQPEAMLQNDLLAPPAEPAKGEKK